MKIRVLLSLLWLTVIVSAPIFAFETNDWTSVQTPNFRIITDAALLEAQRSAAKFESFRRVFDQICAKERSNSDYPLTIIAFNNLAAQNFSLSRNAESQNSFFIVGEARQRYAVLSLENVSDRDYQLIFRNYAKHLLIQRYGETNLPLWVKEGWPAFLQTFRLKTGNVAAFARLSNVDAQLLRNGSKSLFLERLLNLDYNQWQTLNDEDKNLVKIQAAALARFLVQKTENALRNRSITLLETIAKSNKSEEALGQFFQTDLGTLEKEFKKSLEQNSFQETNVSLADNESVNPAQWPPASLSAAQTKTILGDLLGQNNQLVEAQKLLEQAVLLDDKSAAAHGFLGITLVKQNNFIAGTKQIEQAITLEPGNYLWHFYQALAISRENTDATGFVRSFTKQQSANLRLSLARSIELNPNFAEAYRLSALINYVNNEDLDGGLEALDKALKIAPGNLLYELETAQLNVRLENFDEAQKTGERILRIADSPEVRIRARILLTSISSIRAELKKMQNVRPGQGKNAPEPVQMSPEEALNQALNEALRKPQTGEKRIVGFLIGIDCNEQGVNFIVRPQNQATAQSLKLNASEFKKVFLRTFAPGVEGRQINCGMRASESFVVVTYRPAHANSSLNEIVSLEFVPAEFKLLG